MLRQKYTWFIIAAYLILMIGFAFYWGDNFTKFVHFKGDDVGVIVTFSILLSCLFFTMLAFNGVKFKGWLILILPIAITGLSVFTGTVLLFTTGISGTPQQLTWLYLLPYTIFAILAVLIEMKSKRVEA
jgi:hypothetical protein